MERDGEGWRGVKRVMTTTDLLCKCSRLLFCVRHAHKVPEGQLVHAVTSSAHLLVHLVTAADTIEHKELHLARELVYAQNCSLTWCGPTR